MHSNQGNQASNTYLPSSSPPSLPSLSSDFEPQIDEDHARASSAGTPSPHRRSVSMSVAEDKDSNPSEHGSDDEILNYENEHLRSSPLSSPHITTISGDEDDNLDLDDIEDLQLDELTGRSTSPLTELPASEGPELPSVAAPELTRSPTPVNIHERRSQLCDNCIRLW